MKFDRVQGETFGIGDVRLTPVATSLRIELPGKLGGLLWNRPHSILLESANGEVREYRIWDFTRMAQVCILGVAALFFLVFRRKNSV